MENINSKMVLADFDETIIDCDSLVTIMIKEKWFLDISLIVSGINIILAKVFKGDVLKKRSAFKYIMMCKYGEMSYEDQEGYIDYFKKHINKDVINKIQQINAEKVIVASASDCTLIERVLDGVLKVDHIIANTECKNSKDFITCYGQQKADRVCKEIEDYHQYDIFVFSDSMSDRPIFDLGKYNYLVKDGHFSQI